MHLAGPGLTTTSYKKRKEKITKAKQAELEQGWKERNIRLREMGLPKETLEQYTDWVYGRGKKESTKGKSVPQAQGAAKGQSAHGSKGSKPAVEEANETKRKGLWVVGPLAAKPSPVYTGEKMIGISTMHKSNMVPVFSDSEAKDIARMRR